MQRKYLLLILLAAVAALPGIFVRWAGLQLSPPLAALVAGGAILGASFLLLWACDAAQTDISQALALAVVALIAVLPEYAVDMYFAWQAGQFPDSDYGSYAAANMTGANRLIIGVAWSVVVLICWLRSRRAVRLEENQRTEVIFLGLATAYAFLVVAKRSLAWYDAVVFIGLYVWYLALSAGRPRSEHHAEGPAELLTNLAKAPRRWATAIMFLFAAVAILVNARPFCEGLLGTGRLFKISEFLLVQWIAPLASEAPEFTVAIMFAWRGRDSAALGSLLSAKLNQWTLLVGMIPVVFAISARSLAYPIPMVDFQMQEIFLTAAQSLLAVVILARLSLSMPQAALLFFLFAGQLVLPGIVAQLPGGHLLGLYPAEVHPAFSIAYLVIAAFIMVRWPASVLRLREGLVGRGA
ncbi:MAG: sodium:calcium antiporter [Lentisphaerae bacterium]|nr:sodium:calcium antiporter [Lentisphaerota bacterium]